MSGKGQELLSILAKLAVDAPVVKTVSGLLGAMIAYALPTARLQELAAWVGASVAVDTITGVAASLKQGHKLSSARWSRIVTKLIAYYGVLFVSVGAARQFPGSNPEYWTGLVLGVLFANEAISILENAHVLGAPIPARLVKMLKGRLDLAEMGEPKKESE